LAEKFQRASTSQRRRATLLACETVVSTVGLGTFDDVLPALDALRSGRYDEGILRGRLEALSEGLDAEYLRLDEENGEANAGEAQRYFAQARGISALALALTQDASTLHESIYESISALIKDANELIHRVEFELHTGTNNENEHAGD
jgi:hypothetical protein